jgi:hypothetical protein
VLLVVAFNAVMLMLLEIPLLCLLVAPGWTIGAIDRTKGWIGRHHQRFAVIMLACSPAGDQESD